jgi:hypothetical protein
MAKRPDVSERELVFSNVVILAVLLFVIAITHVPGNRPPFVGAPGSTIVGGTGSRTYGPDGYPQTDRDSPHPDESGIGAGDHSHDWGRPADGGRPTHNDRGPPRRPEPKDPPPPRGPNVPPPDNGKN